MSDTVKFPFGAPNELTLSASGDQDLTIVDMLTIVDGSTTVSTADRTINITLDDDLEVGAKLFMKFTFTSTETVIFGDNITGTTITGVADKTITRTATYDGSVFMIDNEQID